MDGTNSRPTLQWWLCSVGHGFKLAAVVGKILEYWLRPGEATTISAILQYRGLLHATNQNSERARYTASPEWRTPCVCEFIEYLHFNSWPTFSPYLYNRIYSELTSRNSLSRPCLSCSSWVDTSSQQQQNSPRLETLQAWNEHALLLTDKSVNKVQLQRSWITVA